MKNYNYSQLMSQEPFKLNEMMNSKGQLIELYEHPTKGDEVPVICVCHELKMAAESDFFETSDLMEDHREYEPWFDEEGKLRTGE